MRKFSQANTESIGRLFLEFLWQFAFKINPRTEIVTVTEDEGEDQHTTPHSSTKSRARKVSLAHWRAGGVLGIEDPFEQDYDVAHVLRPNVRIACAIN